MQVPFVDLRAQADELGDEYLAVMQDIMTRAAYTLGPEVSEFEKRFGEFCGSRQCVGVSSGTDALRLAYLAVGVEPGDEIIMPVNTFIATAEAASHIGAVPVFVDCLGETSNIDPAGIERVITSRTKAIVPVHLYGQVAEMTAILEIAERHGLVVVEDACQAHGAQYRGRRAGSLGTAAAFSFYPGKNLGALGDGGAVVTSDDVVADRLRILRNHGQVDKYTHAVVGYCNRLHNLQAGFLNCKLPHLAASNEARRTAARAYDSLLRPMDGVRTVDVREECESVYHLYVVEVDDRDTARERLDEAGIQSGIHYAVPLHLTPAYAHRGYGRGDFPVAERLAERILSLPVYPGISLEQIEHVAKTLETSLQ